MDERLKSLHGDIHDSTRKKVKEFAPCKENWQFNKECGVLTISGGIATGKTTLTDILSKIYKVPTIKIGEIIREITDTSKQEDPIERTDDVNDAMDSLQEEVMRDANAKNPRIMESRFAAIIADKEKKASLQKKLPIISILLTTSRDEAIKRILDRDKNHSLSEEEAGKKLDDRTKDDLELAHKKFGTDIENIFDYKYFDLVINTDKMDQTEVAETVHNYLLENNFISKKEDQASSLPTEHQIFPSPSA